MAVAWSWAFDTPFKWTKQVASHFGGTRQGLAISWPGHIKDVGAVRHQFHHIIDIVPTILEATGIKAPADGRRHQAEADRGREHGVHVRRGERQRALDAQDPVLRDDLQPRHLPRGLVCEHGPAGAAVGPEREDAARSPTTSGSCTTSTEDFSQDDDLAAKNPAKLKEMQALFQQEAAKYDVLPLDNSQFQRAIAPRPSAVAGKTVFTYAGENPGIPLGNAPNILNKSFTITAEIEVPKGGAEGMIVTAGGRFGGYGLYILKGKPVFTYNLLDLEADPLGRRRGQPRPDGRLARRPASTRSCSTSRTTAPASPRAAPAC